MYSVHVVAAYCFLRYAGFLLLPNVYPVCLTFIVNRCHFHIAGKHFLIYVQFMLYCSIFFPLQVLFSVCVLLSACIEF